MSRKAFEATYLARRCDPDTCRSPPSCRPHTHKRPRHRRRGPAAPAWDSVHWGRPWWALNRPPSSTSVWGRGCDTQTRRKEEAIVIWDAEQVSDDVVKMENEKSGRAKGERKQTAVGHLIKAERRTDSQASLSPWCYYLSDRKGRNLLSIGEALQLRRVTRQSVSLGWEAHLDAGRRLPGISWTEKNKNNPKLDFSIGLLQYVIYIWVSAKNVYHISLDLF